MTLKLKTHFTSINNVPFYVAEPRSGSKKAIILFPEAFSITGHMQDVAHRLAHEGFKVYLLQLYFKQHKNPDFFIDYSNKSLREELLTQLCSNDFIKEFSGLKSHFNSYSEIATIGFSIGGYFSMLAASILNLKKVVTYYPNPTINNKSYNLQPMGNFLNPNLKPLMFFGAKDHSIPGEEIELIKASLSPQSYIVTYPNSSHGFFCNSRHTYNKTDSRHSWDILLKHLKMD